MNFKLEGMTKIKSEIIIQIKNVAYNNSIFINVKHWDKPSSISLYITWNVNQFLLIQ